MATATDRPMSSTSILVRACEEHLPEDFKPCVTDTFRAVPSTGVVVVPLRVFRIFPEIVHPKFRSDGDDVFSDGDVNVFMTFPGLNASTSGYVDEVTQAWVMAVSTLGELEEAIHQLSTFPTLTNVTLTIRSVLEDSARVPMVIFLSPESTCIKDLISKLEGVKGNFTTGKKFCVEVDLGPSLETWGKSVLRREFLSVGGRFCVTNGAMFNHVFDWNNVLGCIPCLPCGIIGSSAYRIHRKINYQDAMIDGQLDIMIIGTKGMDQNSQQYATYLLMEWIRVFKLYYCVDCRRRLPTTEDEEEDDSFCSCTSGSLSPSLIPSNKVSPMFTTEDGGLGDLTGSDDGFPEKAGKTRRELRREDRRRRRRMRKKRRRAKAGNGTGSGEEDSDDSDGSSSSDYSEDDALCSPTGNSGLGSGSGSKTKRIPSKSKHRGKKKSSHYKGPFAPYAHAAAGESIARKEHVLTHSNILTKPEVDVGLHILESWKQNGFSTPSGPRAVFRYPQTKKKGFRKHRSIMPDFEEIQLTIAGQKDNGPKSVEANTAVTETELPVREHSSEGNRDDNLYEDNDNAFYFSANDANQRNEANIPETSDMTT